MKKLLLLSLIAFMVFSQSNIDAYASYSPAPGDITFEDLPSNVIDSSGHVTDGTLVFRMNQNSSANGVIAQFSNAKYLYILKTVGSSSDRYDFYAYRDNTSSPLRLKAGNLYDVDLSSDSDMSEEILKCIDGLPEYTYNQAYWSDFWNIQKVGGFFVTNIPIFDVNDTISLNNYKNNGDKSGALNYREVVPPPTLPTPVNLKISSASKTDSSSKFKAPIVVQWDCGSNLNFDWHNLRYKIQYQITYGRLVGVLEDSATTGLVTIANNVLYRSGSVNYTISTDTLNSTLNLSIGNSGVEMKSYWIKNVVVYITNIQSTDLTNLSASRYVQYDYITKVTDTDSTTEEESSTEGGSDSENGSDGVGDGSQNGTQYNGNGVTVNVTQNNNGNGGTNSSGGSNFFDVIVALIEGLTNIVSGFISAVGGAITGLLDAFTGIVDGTSEIGSFIHSGFGLLGENGFVSMISSFMTFVPQEIWTIIITGVSVSITLLIASAVLKFLRG